MKKCTLLLASVFLLFQAVFAQTKITKTAIIGKWELSVIDTKGMMSYDADKDSIRFAQKIDSIIQDPKQRAEAISQLKMKMGLMYKNMSYTFHENGNCVLSLGNNENVTANGNGSAGATYTVDEITSTLTIFEKGIKLPSKFKAELYKQKLKLIFDPISSADLPLGGKDAGGYLLLRRSNK